MRLDDQEHPLAHPSDSGTLSRRTARDLLWIVLLSAPLLWLGLGNHHFWLVDEPFVAEVAREMHVSGDYLVPRLNGEPFLEKPPLHYAAIALAYRWLGVTPLAARLPSAAAGLLTLFVTYFLGRRLLGRRAGLWGALLLPTSYLFFYVTHYCLVDATLALFVTTGFLAGSHALGKDARPWAVPAAYGAAALAFLTKGFVGPLMIALGLIAFAAWRQDWSIVRARGHLVGFFALAASMGGWAYALWNAGGAAFLWEAYVANSVGRVCAVRGLVPRHDTLSTHDVTGPALLFGLLGNIAPWTPALLWLLLSARVRGAAAARDAVTEHGDVANPSAAAAPAWGRAFLGAVLVVNLVALALVHNKRGMYLLPLYPLMALLMAGEADRLCRAGESAPRAARWLFGIQTTIACLLALGTAASPLLMNRFVLGEPDLPADPLLVGTMSVAALLTIALAVRSHLRRAHATLLATIWGQSAACLAVVALVLFPRADAQKSFAKFFSEVKAVTEARGVSPVLDLHNEAYTGLAALAFQRILPVAAGREALHREFLRHPDLYVIATHPRAATLPESSGAQSEIVAQEVIAGPMGERALYLVHLSRPPG